MKFICFDVINSVIFKYFVYCIKIRLGYVGVLVDGIEYCCGIV